MALTVGRKPFRLKDFQQMVSNQYLCFKLFTVEVNMVVYSSVLIWNS